MIILKKWQIAAIATLIVFGLFFVDGGAIYVKQLLNRAPKAAFTYRTPTRTMKYIAPTDRDTILFLNNSTDADGDPLTSQWFIRFNGTGDWKLLNTSTHHWGRLLVSNEKGHEIKLTVSDGMKEDSTMTIIPVDPYRLPQFSPKKLRFSVKGVNLIVGIKPWPSAFPYLADQEIDESIAVIEELGCNAVKIVGDDRGTLVRTAERALQKFDTVMICPRYISTNADETLRQLIDVSRDMEIVRKRSSHRLVLMIGDEFDIALDGIIPLPSNMTATKYPNKEAFDRAAYDYRAVEIDKTGLNTTQQGILRRVLDSIVQGVKREYKGEVSYVREIRENVEWDDIGFDVAHGSLMFGSKWMTEEQYKQKADRLKSSIRNKPAYVDVSVYTYEGCMEGGGWRRAFFTSVTYSQQAQADGIDRTAIMLDQTRIDGLFIWSIVSRDIQESSGLLKYDGPGRFQRRKLGFYAYQSFVVA
jgi:hypothetical protein